MSTILKFLIEPFNLLTFIIGGLLTWFIYYKSKKSQQNGRDLLSYIPNVWTSLGILGTFISIFLSLSNIKNSDIDIIKLVSEIIPAFSTSIIGIFGAITSSIWIKIVFAKEDQKDDDEQNTPEYALKSIDRHLLKITSIQLKKIESLLTESISTSLSQTNHITDMLNNQSSILREFVDDFIRNMNDIFAEMKDSIEHQTRQFGQEQFGRSSEIVESLQQKLNTIIQEHTDNTQQILENNNQQFRESTQQLGDFIEELKTEMSVSIQQTVDRLKESYDFIDSHTAQLITNYEQSTAAFKDAVQNAHDWNKSVTDLLQSINENSENQKKTNEQVIETIKVIESRQEKTDNLVARIQEMSAAIDALQRLESQLNRINR